MVERPIKKSERQANESTNDSGDRSSAQPSEPRAERSSRNNDRDRDRGKGGKGRGSKTEEPKMVNPALMRGPRPAKAKPPVPEEVTEEVTAEVQNDDSQEASTDVSPE